MVWKSQVKSWDEYDEPARQALRCMWSSKWLSKNGGATLAEDRLDPLQYANYIRMKKFFAQSKNSFERIWVNEWSRRLGKDHGSVIFVREEMRKNKDHIYYYGTAFEKDINLILIPIIKFIEQDCPPELKLKTQATKGIYTDPETGSELRLVGLDVNPNGIRGNRIDGIVITEYSYCDHIDESETAFSPALVENPNAWRIYNSTPGESTAHKWHMEIVPRAKLSGGYSLHILDECQRFAPEQIEAAYAEFGGRSSTKSRREYRCEHVGEETKLVIPEWIDAKEECTVDEYPRPDYAHCYVALDPGQVDLHGNVYAYYDFLADMLVFERAYTMYSPKTSEISEAIHRDESELWNGYMYHDEYTQVFIKNPYLRVSDTDLRLIKDLSEDYGLTFIGTRKDDLRSAVNALRKRIADRKIRVLPGAFELGLHLDSAIWNKNKTKFEHVSKTLGHFDLLAATIYLHRNLVLHKNPLPPQPRPDNEFCAVKKKNNKFDLKRNRYGVIVEIDDTHDDNILRI